MLKKRTSKNYILFLGANNSESSQQPCLSLIQFQIDRGRLALSAYQRSSDASLGLPSDIYHLYLISKQINVPLRSITLFIGNIHIYEPMQKLLEAGFDKNGGGIYLKIQHKNGFETSYLHLDQFFYKYGDSVAAGAIIGISGNTGNSTAPHLHFAVKENGKFIDPINFLNDLILTNNALIDYENNRKF